MSQDEELIERLRSYAGTCTGLEPQRVINAAADRLEALARPVVGVETGWLSGYPDYLADPAGLERFRQSVIEARDLHDMAPINFNSLARLIDTIDNLRAALAASPSPVVGELSEPTKRMEKILDAPFVRRSAEAFQARVAPWMQECFGPVISADKLERNDRFIEESLELAQSLGYSADRAHALVDYVFERAIGEPAQEVGGVMVTLAALCLAADLDMHDAGEVELVRINRPEIIAKIRAKQAAKPTGSALPIDPHTMDRAGMAQEVE